MLLSNLFKRLVQIYVPPPVNPPYLFLLATGAKPPLTPFCSTQPLKKVEPNIPSGGGLRGFTPVKSGFFKSDLVQDGALREAPMKVDLEKVGVEKNANMKNKEKSYSNKDDSGQKQREQKKEKLAMKKRQEELFGDASLDAIQDQYCDFEDRY